MTKKELYLNICKGSNKELLEFDLRHAAILKKSSDEYKKYMVTKIRRSDLIVQNKTGSG